MKMTRYLILLGLALAMPVYGATTLTPHTAEYKVRIKILSAQLNTALTRQGDSYVAHHVVRPVGMSKMLTRGTMDVTADFTADKDGVKPVRYHAVDTIRDDPDMDLGFDWETNQVSGTVGDDEVALQLDGLSYDNVSIQYALMNDLQNGGTSAEYVLFDIDKMRIAHVTNIGEKEIKTKAGTFTAVGVRHQKEGSSRTTTLWCAKELDYLPVVIEQHRKGKLNFQATLASYTPTPE